MAHRASLKGATTLITVACAWPRTNDVVSMPTFARGFAIPAQFGPTETSGPHAQQSARLGRMRCGPLTGGKHLGFADFVTGGC
jgi:hypothetical protein